MLRGVEKAEADGRDALAHESDALKARKAAAGAAEDSVWGGWGTFGRGV